MRRARATEAAIHRDHLVGAVAMPGAPLARELDRALVRLGAGVGEGHLGQTAATREQIRQADLLVVVEGGAAVDQTVRPGWSARPGSRAANGRGVHRPALDEVEVGAAVTVGEPRTLAAGKDDRRAGGDVHDGGETGWGRSCCAPACWWGGAQQPNTKAPVAADGGLRDLCANRLD